jgi:hypothetical protein
MESTIRDILSRYDGMVLGGNDFLYTKELPAHPMCLFLYQYGLLLRECGVDTIFLENHYTKEPIQTRGFIGQVMYSAYCFGMRVIGIEGKFTPEEYKKYTTVVMDFDCTTVAYTSKKRLDRLNVFVSHFVPCQMRTSVSKKYLLFCGMSHVNNEPGVTDCKGIKEFLGVPGIGSSLIEKGENALTKGKKFVDAGSGYSRDCDYLLEMVHSSSVNDMLFIDSTIFCMIHDYYFFYKSYYRFMIHYKLQPSVMALWNHKTTIYPPRYKEYVKQMIKWDHRMELPEEEIDGVLSYMHNVIHVKQEIPSRKQVADCLRGLTEEDLNYVVDQWVSWLKKLNNGKKLTYQALDVLSDIIFLEYKTLEKRKEEGYIKYLKDKYQKQLERQEHKIHTMFRIMKSLSIPFKNDSQCMILVERIL